MYPTESSEHSAGRRFVDQTERRPERFLPRQLRARRLASAGQGSRRRRFGTHSNENESDFFPLRVVGLFVCVFFCSFLILLEDLGRSRPVGHHRRLVQFGRGRFAALRRGPVHGSVPQKRPASSALELGLRRERPFSFSFSFASEFFSLFLPPETESHQQFGLRHRFVSSVPGKSAAATARSTTCVTK